MNTTKFEICWKRKEKKLDEIGGLQPQPQVIRTIFQLTETDKKLDQINVGFSERVVDRINIFVCIVCGHFFIYRVSHEN